ncbi:MAG: hypothetical protein M0D53_00830 [Flavobacterium sp. JAD_PAG50586_2]|nr:MAG: hypothetical protein M0D53_00830 [Flavobacterium sp. JAD_PAG50586_2]
MRKYHFILLVLLGMFFMPNTAMACGKGSEKSCCKKEISSTTKEKKSCCNNDSSKEKDHKGCKGKCGHSECGCSSTCPASSVSFLSEINLKNNMFSYSSIGKVKFLYTTPSISDGFYSIWLIPKIS